MSTYRHRFSRRDADRILDHRGDANDPLARLVDAASTTSAPTGEERAIALFTAAALPAAPAGASVMTRLTRKLAALPAAGLAAGALVLGGGGLALAATQGAVHVPFTGHDNRSEHAPEAPSPTNPGLSRTPGAAGEPGASPTNAPAATPNPSLEGLCRAVQAGAVPHRTSNPAFSALAAAAGGAEHVDAYCAALVGPAKPRPTQAVTPPAPKPSQAATPPIPRPTQAASPTTGPKHKTPHRG